MKKMHTFVQVKLQKDAYELRNICIAAKKASRDEQTVRKFES